jgi:hypothetical protein
MDGAEGDHIQEAVGSNNNTTKGKAGEKKQRHRDSKRGTDKKPEQRNDETMELETVRRRDGRACSVGASADEDIVGKMGGSAGWIPPIDIPIPAVADENDTIAAEPARQAIENLPRSDRAKRRALRHRCNVLDGAWYTGTVRARRSADRQIKNRQLSRSTEPERDPIQSFVRSGRSHSMGVRVSEGSTVADTLPGGMLPVGTEGQRFLPDSTALAGHCREQGRREIFGSHLFRRESSRTDRRIHHSRTSPINSRPNDAASESEGSRTRMVAPFHTTLEHAGGAESCVVDGDRQGREMLTQGRPPADGLDGSGSAGHHSVQSAQKLDDADEILGAREVFDQSGKEDQRSSQTCGAAGSARLGAVARKSQKEMYIEPLHADEVPSERRRRPGHTVNRFWPRRLTKRSSAESRENLKLHLKKVTQLDWSRADDLVTRWAPELLSTWVRLTTLWRDTSQWDVHQADFKAAIESSPEITERDLRQLVEEGFLVEIDCSEVKGTCNSFTVDETDKQRRRWILHPRLANVLFSTDDHGVPFPTMEELEQPVLAAFAMTIDYRWFFAQFGIPEGVSLYNCIVHNGRAFRPTTVPTGGAGPPLFAQILTLAVSRAACAAAPGTTVANCFIDNTRFSGTCEASLQIVTDEAFRICEETGIQINEHRSDVTSSTSYVFLGIRFDHKEHTVALSEKTIAKLNRCIKNLQEAAATDWVLDEAQSVFGVCAWASSVIGFAKHEMYYVYKYMRRRARVYGDLNPATRMSLWPSISALWPDWINRLLNATPRVIQSSAARPTITIYTDASNSGWGCIAYVGNMELIVAGRWREDQYNDHINLKELQCVRFALGLLNIGGSDSCTNIALFLDNTSALGQVRKGRSAVYRYNQELGRLEAILHSKGLRIISTEYICTSCNPADFWSRIFEAELI